MFCSCKISRGRIQQTTADQLRFGFFNSVQNAAAVDTNACLIFIISEDFVLQFKEMRERKKKKVVSFFLIIPKTTSAI